MVGLPCGAPLNSPTNKQVPQQKPDPILFALAVFWAGAVSVYLLFQGNVTRLLSAPLLRWFNGKPISWQKIEVLTSKQNATKIIKKKGPPS